MKFDFYSDPGHGWLKVSKEVLKKYIGKDWRKIFSSFSYEKGKYVYLEEDSDVSRFKNWMEAGGQTVEIRQRPQTNSRSRIRNYSILRAI